MTRDKKLSLIWKNTHKDYRGYLGVDDKGKKVKTILMLRNGATTLVPLNDLTDDEIAKYSRYFV